MRNRAPIACLVSVVLAACQPAVLSPSPSPSPAPAVAPNPTATTIAEKVRLVADALSNVLPQLGVTNPRVQEALAIVQQLTSIAGMIPSTGDATNLGGLVLTASNLIQKVAPLVAMFAGPYAPVIAAATAILPSILQLAGVAPQTARLARASMSPAEAELILRQAARR